MTDDPEEAAVADQQQDPQDRDQQDLDQQDVEEAKDAAREMGADVDEADTAEEVVEEVAHTQTDTETSPSGWKAAREEEGAEGADRT